jgi:hypothetical protein
MPVCEQDWKIVRLTRELCARLDVWRAAQLSRGRVGVQRLIGEKYAIISYNAAIRELLDRDERHRERGRRSKKKEIADFGRGEKEQANQEGQVNDQVPQMEEPE